MGPWGESCLLVFGLLRATGEQRPEKETWIILQLPITGICQLGFFSASQDSPNNGWKRGFMSSCKTPESVAVPLPCIYNSTEQSHMVRGAVNKKKPWRNLKGPSTLISSRIMEKKIDMVHSECVLVVGISRTS